jgi:hypothetical protein
VARLRLVHLAGVDGAEAELDGAVAVVLVGPYLGHDARAGLDQGDRDEAVALVPDLGHPELAAQDAAHVALHGAGHDEVVSPVRA